MTKKSAAPAVEEMEAPINLHEMHELLMGEVQALRPLFSLADLNCKNMLKAKNKPFPGTASFTPGADYVTARRYLLRNMAGIKKLLEFIETPEVIMGQKDPDYYEKA